MNTTKIFVIIVLLLGSTQVLPRVLYVKKGNTNPVTPFLTPATAADSIKKATLISKPGDTIYVFNGKYNEQVVLKDSTSLIGQSKAGTIIEKNYIYNNFPKNVIEVANNSLVKNLSVSFVPYINHGTFTCAIGNYNEDTIVVRNVTIDSIFIDTRSVGNPPIGISSGKITNCEFWIDDVCFDLIAGAFHQDKLLLECENIVVKGVERIFFGWDEVNTLVKFRNCSFRAEGNLRIATLFSCTNINASFTNCLLVWGDQGYQGADYSSDINFNLDLENCTLSGRWGTLFNYYYGKMNVRNTLFYGPSPVFNFNHPGTLNFKYNFFSNSKIPAQFDSTNINGCNTPPNCMFNSNLPLEWRLDMFSEAIDKGDPALKDADGSRSDIGAAGGPGGFSYAYPDLAPQIPDTVWASTNTSTGTYHLFWRKNCEQDFSRYKVYGGTDNNSYCDNTLFLGETVTPAIATDISRFPGGLPFVHFLVYDTAGHQSVCHNHRQRAIAVTVIEDGTSKQEEIGLLNCYPSPSSGMLTIKYRIPVFASVSLKVYNTTGEETAEVLCNEERQAGTYTQQVHLNGASGIYIVRLAIVNDKGEKKEFTQKVSLVR